MNQLFKKSRWSILAGIILAATSLTPLAAQQIDENSRMGRPVYIGPAGSTGGGEGNVSINNNESNESFLFNPPNSGVTGDNLGNHTATQNLNMGGSRVVSIPLNPNQDNEAASKYYVDQQISEIMIEINNIWHVLNTHEHDHTHDGDNGTNETFVTTTGTSDTPGPQSCPQGISMEERERTEPCPDGSVGVVTVYESRTNTTPFGTCDTSYGSWRETRRDESACYELTSPNPCDGALVRGISSADQQCEDSRPNIITGIFDGSNRDSSNDDRESFGYDDVNGNGSYDAGVDNIGHTDNDPTNNARDS